MCQEMKLGGGDTEMNKEKPSLDCRGDRSAQRVLSVLKPHKHKNSKAQEEVVQASGVLEKCSK